MKRKHGGQPGNRNAMKHGFYSKVLSPEENQALHEADSLQGLDAEIAILRLKISQLLKRDPDNLNLMLRASAILARLLRIQFQLNPQQVQGLHQAVGNVMRDIALPLGLDWSHLSRKWQAKLQKNLSPSPDKIPVSPQKSGAPE